MEQIRAFVAKRDMLRIRAILLSFLLRFDSDKWDLTQIWLRYLCQKMAVGASGPDIASLQAAEYWQLYATWLTPGKKRMDCTSFKSCNKCGTM